MEDKASETPTQKAQEYTMDAIESNENQPETVNNQPEKEPNPLTELQKQLEESRNKYLYLFSDFENYKRNAARERMDLISTAGRDMMAALLPVLDDFDRALVEISKSEDKAMLLGVELIHEKFKSTLFSKGLEEVEVRKGDAFNADYAEAITQIPAPTADLKGKIVDVLEKGYKLGDKIIRFPKVVLGN